MNRITTLLNTTVLALAAVLAALWTAAIAIAQDTETSGEQPTRVVAGFPDATVTIFPVAYDIVGPINEHRVFYERLMGPPGQQLMAPLPNALSLMLHEQGYANATTTDTQVPLKRGTGEADDRGDRAAVFAETVRGLDLDTDYALCTQIVMHLRESTVEVYAALAKADGTVVWEDSQRPGSAEFEANFPGTPTKCMALVVRRLTPVMGLDTLPKARLPDDKAAALRLIRAEDPPDQTELDAVEARLAKLREQGARATVAVYPTRLGGDRADEASTKRLREMLNEAALCNAVPGEAPHVLAGEGWPNQMRVLWLYAHEVRDHLRDNPPEADYALFADYWLRPHDNAVHAVHFIVCDRAGDWVIVDLQNSHHPAFQQINPRTLADCDALVLHRYTALTR